MVDKGFILLFYFVSSCCLMLGSFTWCYDWILCIAWFFVSSSGGLVLAGGAFFVYVDIEFELIAASYFTSTMFI